MFMDPFSQELRPLPSSNLFSPAAASQPPPSTHGEGYDSFLDSTDTPLSSPPSLSTAADPGTRSPLKRPFQSNGALAEQETGSTHPLRSQINKRLKTMALTAGILDAEGSVAGAGADDIAGSSAPAPEPAFEPASAPEPEPRSGPATVDLAKPDKGGQDRPPSSSAASASPDPSASSNNLLVPGADFQQRLLNTEGRLSDADMELALRIYTCSRPDVRLGNSIASFSGGGEQSPTDSFNPAFLVEDETLPEGDCGSTSLGDGDYGDHSGVIDRRLWITLPIHKDDHWQINMVAVTQHMGDALAAAADSSSSASRDQQEQREHNFHTSMQSVNVCNSIAATTPTDDQTIMRTATALLSSNTNSMVRCCPGAPTDQNRQEPKPVVHRLPSAQQDPDSVGCGIFAIVYVLRFLRNTDTIHTTAALPINEILWRRLLSLLFTACASYAQDNGSLTEVDLEASGGTLLRQAENSGAQLSREQGAPDKEQLSNPTPGLSGSTLVDDGLTSCNLNSEGLEKARAEVERVAREGWDGQADTAAAFAEKLHSAAAAVDRQLLDAASGHQARIKVAIRDLVEMLDLHNAAHEGAALERTRLEQHVIPRLQQHHQERERLRKALLGLTAAPLVESLSRFWQLEDAFERKRLRFCEQRAAEAAHSSAVGGFVARVLRKDLSVLHEALDKVVRLAETMEARLGS